MWPYECSGRSQEPEGQEHPGDSDLPVLVNFPLCGEQDSPGSKRSQGHGLLKPLLPGSAADGKAVRGLACPVPLPCSCGGLAGCVGLCPAIGEERGTC